MRKTETVKLTADNFDKSKEVKIFHGSIEFKCNKCTDAHVPGALFFFEIKGNKGFEKVDFDYTAKCARCGKKNTQRSVAR